MTTTRNTPAPAPGTSTGNASGGARGFVRNRRHLWAIRRIAAERLMLATEKVTQRAKHLLSQPGAGIHHPGNPAPSSLPGEPPARQSGTLAESQTTRGPVHRRSGVTAASGSDDPRAATLQLGTNTTRPRPYALRALTESRQDVLAAFGEGGAG